MKLIKLFSRVHGLRPTLNCYCKTREFNHEEVYEGLPTDITCSACITQMGKRHFEER